MAERKYTGTDAELLRLKREGLSLRAIAAQVGVVGVRIARAEAAERRRAQSTAPRRADDEDLGEAAAAQPAAARDQRSPDESRAARSRRRGASAATSPGPRAGGPIDIRAGLEAIAQDPKAGYRERLGALTQLAKMGDGAAQDDARPLRFLAPGAIVLEKLKSPPSTTPGYRISIRKPGGIGVDHIDSGLTAKQAIALLAQALVTDDPNAA